MNRKNVYSIAKCITETDFDNGFDGENDDELIKYLTSVEQVNQSELAPELGETIVKYLDHDNPSVICVATRALAHLGGTDAGQAAKIAFLLHHQDETVRGLACAALSRLESANIDYAVDIMKVAEAATTNMPRVLALKSLGEMGAVSEVKNVAKYLNSPFPDVASAACQSLGRMGDAASFWVADIANKMSSDHTRYSALSALYVLGPQLAAQHIDDIIEVGLGAADFPSCFKACTILETWQEEVIASAGSIEKIAKLLDGEVHVRCMSAYALGRLGAGPFVNRIVKLLDDDDEDFSWVPLKSGGALQRPDAAMRKPRCAALEALGALRSDQHMREIAEFLNNIDWEVRLSATSALTHIGCDASVHSGDVANVLDDEAFLVRAEACMALGAMKAEDQVDRLADMLKDPVHTVRASAAEALGVLGEASEEFCDEIFELVNDQSSIVRAAAVSALVELGLKTYASVIAQMMNDPASNVRIEALKALPRFGERGQAFVDEIPHLLKDEVPEVRMVAAETLEKMVSP